jgi:hypothetical protein
VHGHEDDVEAVTAATGAKQSAWLGRPKTGQECEAVRLVRASQGQ